MTGLSLPRSNLAVNALILRNLIEAGNITAAIPGQYLFKALEVPQQAQRFRRIERQVKRAPLIRTRGRRAGVHRARIVDRDISRARVQWNGIRAIGPHGSRMVH